MFLIKKGAFESPVHSRDLLTAGGFLPHIPWRAGDSTCTQAVKDEHTLPALGQGLHLSEIPRSRQDPRHQAEPKVVGCRMRTVHIVWINSGLITAWSGRLNKCAKAAGMIILHSPVPSGKPSRGCALQKSLVPLPVMAEVLAGGLQGACRGPGEFIQTQEGVSGLIYSCTDLVIAPLGQHVKGYLLAHAFTARMGMVRFSPFHSLGFFYCFSETEQLSVHQTLVAGATVKGISPSQPSGKAAQGRNVALGTEQEQLAQ